MEDEKHFLGKIAQKAIIEKDGKVLVCLGIGDAVWEFPGGRLHFGETPQEGIVREIMEELNLPIKVKGPIHACRSYHSKSNAWNVFISYHCTVEGKAVENIDQHEVQETKWISFEELKTLPMFDDCREAADVFLRERKAI